MAEPDTGFSAYVWFWFRLILVSVVGRWLYFEYIDDIVSQPLPLSVPMG